MKGGNTRTNQLKHLPHLKGIPPNLNPKSFQAYTPALHNSPSLGENEVGVQNHYLRGVKRL